jgi:CRP/FNR family transcriptional regulator, cyclic AMP receptor protein
MPETLASSRIRNFPIGLIMEDNNEVINSSFWANLFKPSAQKLDNESTLTSYPPFLELSRKDLSLLSDVIHNRQYLAGEHIFTQGDPGIGLYIIRDGEVEITYADKRGQILRFASFNKGDFFGELALVDGGKRNASALAKTDVKLAVIFKPDLDNFIEKYPKKGIKILHGITSIITTRLRKLDEEFLNL